MATFTAVLPIYPFGELSVNAKAAEELVQAIEDIAKNSERLKESAGITFGRNAEISFEKDVSVAGEDTAEEEESKPKRKRRTKAEMERDRKAAAEAEAKESQTESIVDNAAEGKSGSETDESTVDWDAVAETDEGKDATEGDADKKKEKPLTADDVRVVLKKLAPSEVGQVARPFVPEGKPLALDSIAPEDYAALIAAAKSLLES